MSPRAAWLPRRRPDGSWNLIRFRLSVRPADQIEATGELTWNDERRKSGGMRFIKLPDELHEQIRIWLGQPQVAYRPNIDKFI